MTTVGFLGGLGHMGGPMAANLVNAGYTVRGGFDPVPALRAAAEGKGVTVFDAGAAAVSEADVVITSLPNGAIVKACYAEALPAATSGTLFIDTSTISVDDAREVNAQASAAGMAQLDAPRLRWHQGRHSRHARIHGRRRRRRAGEGPTGAGSDGQQGDSLRIVGCRPGRQAVQQHGAGRAADRRGGEAFVLAEKLGLSAQSLFDVITGATGNCWAVHTNCPVPGPVSTSPANNNFQPGFATALMNKDLGLAMDAVSSTGATAPLAPMPPRSTPNSPKSTPTWISARSSKPCVRNPPPRGGAASRSTRPAPGLPAPPSRYRRTPPR